MNDASAVLAGLDGELGWIHECYMDLHRHPEPSFAEHRSAELIATRLAEFGYAVQHIGGTGVVGVLANGPGATVLSRADMDALPVAEETGLAYASAVDGLMHACGHDVHMAALLGAAKLMADGRAAWSGTFIALFQPAEEVGGGAQAMVDDGLLTKVPRPDVVLGQHVMPLPAGILATRPGAVLSGSDSIKITVYGQGTHGSMPHLGVDPVVLAASIVLRLQTVVSRETQPGEFAVVTVGAINAGTKANIIPAHAVLRLSVRNYDMGLRNSLLAAIERIVRGECAAAGSPREPEFSYYDQVPVTLNDEATTETLDGAFQAHFGAAALERAERQTASEDFSIIPDAYGVPYTYWFLGGSDPAYFEKGAAMQKVPANHSPFFAPVIDPTLSMGVQAHVVAALAYLAPAGSAGTGAAA